MLVSADQIVAHLVGDYILQSDWMANEKTKRSVAAVAHALTYALPFLFFRPSLAAFTFIVATHFVIDRWRLARYVVWAKNWLAPWTVVTDTTWNLRYYFAPNRPWRDCSSTGYDPERPAWLAVWLLIIADNTLHLICNGIALRFFN
jgi:hypothetical protein